VRWRPEPPGYSTCRDLDTLERYLDGGVGEIRDGGAGTRLLRMYSIARNCWTADTTDVFGLGSDHAVAMRDREAII
jgi:hypothetical protein